MIKSNKDLEDVCNCKGKFSRLSSLGYLLAPLHACAAQVIMRLSLACDGKMYFVGSLNFLHWLPST
jgi:hypothetical protein